METPRWILYHKQADSARLRFFHFERSVLVFSPLPKPARLADTHSCGHLVRPHPAAWLANACHSLDADLRLLEAQAGFYEEANHRGQPCPVLLARFTCIDPPFLLAQRHHAQFSALCELRQRDAVELELLRRAYEFIIG